MALCNGKSSIRADIGYYFNIIGKTIHITRVHRIIQRLWYSPIDPEVIIAVAVSIPSPIEMKHMPFNYIAGNQFPLCWW